MNVADQVKLELKELASLNIRVPRKAYHIADTDAKKYRDNGMSISEIADLCIQLAQVSK